MDKDIKCLKCGSKIMLIREVDWDNCVTYCRPLCTNTFCGWTTKRTFDNAEQMEQYIEDLKAKGFKNKRDCLLDFIGKEEWK